MTDLDTRGRVIMTADCVYRGDRYQLSADVSGPARPCSTTAACARGPAGGDDASRRVLGVDGGQSAIRLRHFVATAVGNRGARRQPARGRHGRRGRRAISGLARGGLAAIDRVGAGADHGAHRSPRPASGCARGRRGHGCRRGVAGGRLGDHPCRRAVDGLGRERRGRHGRGLPGGPGAGAARIIGGHGYLLGDEGGAFWIGSAGLRAVLRAEDGRGQATALSAVAAQRFDGLADLGDRLHSAARPVNDIAQFAPDVLAVGGCGGRGGERRSRTMRPRELVLLIRARGRRGAGRRDRTRVGAGGARWPAAGARPARSGAARSPAPRRTLPGAAARTADGSPLDGAIALGRPTTPAATASWCTSGASGSPHDRPQPSAGHRYLGHRHGPGRAPGDR